jgi:ribonuclease HI
MSLSRFDFTAYIEGLRSNSFTGKYEERCAWACLVLDSNYEEEFVESGKVQTEKTSYHMIDLLAVVNVLEALFQYKKSTEGETKLSIRVLIDSSYVKFGVISGLKKWKRNNWKRGRGKPLGNKKLWKRLDLLISKFSIEWVWIESKEELEPMDKDMYRRVIKLAKLKSF